MDAMRKKLRAARTSLPSLLFLLVSFSTISISAAMADETSGPDSRASSSARPAVHIVYTERPRNEDPEDFNIRTLASVLGSEEAAKDALLYNYKTAASGFSAKLTPDQVSQISQQPGVLQVVADSQLQLHRYEDLAASLVK